jgi:dipeptidyl-peptidase-4
MSVRRTMELRVPLAVGMVATLTAFAMPARSQVTRDDYARAERMLLWNAAALVRNARVQPHWIDGSDRFWYRHETAEGGEFLEVDPTRGTRRPAFDHARLAAALSRAADSVWTAEKLPFDSIAFVDSARAFEVDAAGSRWRCALPDSRDAARDACARIGPVARDTLGVLRSPDGKWEAFVRGYDLYLRVVASGEVVRLTTDGARDLAYGAQPGGRTTAITDLRSGRALPPDAIWSPDSKRLLTQRLDERGVGEMYLLESARADGNYRPKLWSYHYPVPGDSVVPRATLLLVDVQRRAVSPVRTDPLDVLFASPIGLNQVWWDSTGSTVYALRRERGMRAYQVMAIDAASGATRVVLEERGPTLVEPHLSLGARPNIRVLRDGSIVGYSERDGWGHLYLFDGATGAVRSRITRGPWVVRDFLALDERTRTVLFTATAREAGSDPYYRKLYRAKLDGSGLRLLTPEEADHQVTLSPSGRYVVDRYSRVDLAPRTVLRDARDGHVLRTLEEADVSRLLATGWRWPERFHVKAADGATDIYGVIYLPSTFDSTRRYPVLDEVYPGPQAIKSPTGFTPGGDARALAELGFVVVNIDGRGTPYRSKAFHDYQYGKLELGGGLEDHVAGLRELAERRPYLDLGRAGIYGHSGGGFMSARAMMLYPDFYKVGVSSAGNHDQRGYISLWGETYMGLPVEHRYDAQSNASLAKNLKGKLLLAFGDLDDNVQPALTMQLIDALEKANRDYDLLVVPNANHAFSLTSTYFMRRRWDYFVTHLLGQTPPPNYEIPPVDARGFARVMRSLAPE